MLILYRPVKIKEKMKARLRTSVLLRGPLNNLQGLKFFCDEAELAHFCCRCVDNLAANRQHPHLKQPVRQFEK